MSKKADSKALSLMEERFGHDSLISLATIDDNRPSVRIVNSYYENGAFFTVTYALSSKIQQIRAIRRLQFAENGLLLMV